jgi:hypothetical protein
VKRPSPKTQRLLVDILIGLGLAILIVLIVIFAPHAEPTFIYQAF